MKNKKCPICQNKIKEENARQCSICHSQFDQEKIHCESMCSLIKNPLNTQSGIAKLTNQRFIYIQTDQTLTYLFGILGTLISQALRKKIDLDIPLENIKSFEEKKSTFSKTITLKLNDGQEHKFSFISHDLWKSALLTNLP